MQMENGIMNITQKDRELLFKDLSARLPYHVRVKVWLKDETTEEGVLDLEHNYADVLRDAFYYNKIVDIKPYLRPMSSMTNEEKKEYYKLCISKFIKAGPGYTYDGWWEYYDTTASIDWATKKMFDYRGLINKGLALEAPKDMYRKNIEIQIVGGNIGINPKVSSIVNKLSDILDADIVKNGGWIEDLPIELSSDLILWMPNIVNEEPKHYPHKKVGSVLICSKVMREGYRKIDAVSRIFKLHGNAVIAIYKDTTPFIFELIDALGNVWYKGSDLSELSKAILKFYDFTKEAVRVQTKREDIDIHLDNEILNTLDGLIQINIKLQKHIETSCGNRFFGNISTRCQKLFPSFKINSNYMFVSPRNSNKESLTSDDMVLYSSDNTYSGNNKPSVDSPTQIKLYKLYPNINFMIHGHAVISGIGEVNTNNYRLCGDTREVDEILEVVNTDEKSFVVNLKNHGFLIGANSLNSLNELVDKIISNANIKITNQD